MTSEPRSVPSERPPPSIRIAPLKLRRGWLAWRPALGAILVAVIAAGFAIAFRSALATVLTWFGGSPNVVVALGRAPWWARALVPAFGALLGGIFARFAARSPAGHGVADVMEAVVVGRVRLSARVTLLKSLASWLAIASGGSIGREGPLIQFGGATGNLVSRVLRLAPEHARILIAAGTAAGFASAYNTPFAAILFVLEVVTGVVVLQAIVPALVATVIATALTRAFVGEGPIYGQRVFSLHSPLELAAFAGLGVVIGLAAQGFMQLLLFGERMFRRPSLPLPWRSAAGGLLAGLVIVAMPEVAGNGYEPLNLLLDGRFSLPFVAVLLLGKCVATVASVSSGSPGGVFTPTLLIGGAIGFLYAAAVNHCGLPLGPAGGYALVGMAAAAAATTHAPIMSAVLVFELSGDYAIVLPLILTTALATWVSRKLRRDSIYTAELRQRGVGWEFTIEGRRVGAP